MNYLLKISVFLAIGALSLFLQSFNFFKLGSINPNLILIFFSSLVVFYSRKNLLPVIISVLFILSLWSYFFIPFWFEQVILVGLLALSISFLKVDFTGNKLVDLLVVVLILTLLFYLILWAAGLQGFSWLVALEILYNFLIVVPFYFTIKWLKYHTK